MRLRLWLRRGVKLAAAGTVALTVAVAGSVIWVRTGAGEHIFSERDVPPAPVALVLGAQVYPDGTPSPFLAARLDVARRLFETGKVRVILVSGDHMGWDYNEPGGMLRYLTAAGVPTEKVVLDHAGFDTYDSCARARRVFGVRQAIVVTQAFHLARAVTVCRRLGVEATGVGDETVKRFRQTWRIGATRELGACVKAVVDVVSGRDPVHLGRHEPGVEEALKSWR
jgi:vancomycin permeability regulator SanA